MSKQLSKWTKLGSQPFHLWERVYPDGKVGRVMLGHEYRDELIHWLDTGKLFDKPNAYALWLEEPVDYPMSVSLSDLNFKPVWSYNSPTQSFIGYRKTLECAQLVLDLKVRNPKLYSLEH